jgi:DNA-binding transcriptional LysR family regulator
MLPPAMKARKLFDERFRMAQRKGHPRGAGTLSLDAYCGLRHVLVSTSGGSFHGFMDEHLEVLGRSREVALSVQSFTLAAELVCGTDYVSTLPSRLLARYRDRLDSFELPFPAQGFSLYAAWHPRNHADPANRWLRERMVDAAGA